MSELQLLKIIAQGICSLVIMRAAEGSKFEHAAKGILGGVAIGSLVLVLVL